MAKANQNEPQTIFGITLGHLKNFGIRKEKRVNFTLRWCQCIWSSSQSRHCKMCVTQTQPTVPPVDKDNPVEPSFCSTWNRSVCWNESGWRPRREIKCLILMTKEIDSCLGISVGNEGWNWGTGCLFSFSPTFKAYSLGWGDGIICNELIWQLKASHFEDIRSSGSLTLDTVSKSQIWNQQWYILVLLSAHQPLTLHHFSHTFTSPGTFHQIRKGKSLLGASWNLCVGGAHN